MPRAEIASKQAMHTLRQLHAELAGKLIDNKKERGRLVASMRHVEAVLKLLQPGYDVRPIAVRRRKPNKWFKRGTLLRHALDVLRAAEGPLTAREVTIRMLAAKGVANQSAKAVRDLIGSVKASLQNHEGRGVAAGYGDPMRWTVSSAA